MRITPRDIRLLAFINQFGFVSITQCACWLAVSLATAYRRMKKLVDAQYVIHETLFHGQLGSYRLTRAGADVAQSILPPLKRLPRATYHHDLLVVDVSLQLLKQYGGEFISERELRHVQPTVGLTGHVSDGEYRFQGRRVAIEVELTKKSQCRREQIVQHYMRQLDLQAVWYFCGHHTVMQPFVEYANELDFLHVVTLTPFLQTGSGIAPLIARLSQQDSAS